MQYRDRAAVLNDGVEEISPILFGVLFNCAGSLVNIGIVDTPRSFVRVCAFDNNQLETSISRRKK